MNKEDLTTRIVSVACTYCAIPHHDHYECEECAHISSNETFKFCPFCGERL